MEIQATEEQIDKVIQMIEQGGYVSIQAIEARTISLIDDERTFRKIWF